MSKKKVDRETDEITISQPIQSMSLTEFLEQENDANFILNQDGINVEPTPIPIQSKSQGHNDSMISKSPTPETTSQPIPKEQDDSKKLNQVSKELVQHLKDEEEKKSQGHNDSVISKSSSPPKLEDLVIEDKDIHKTEKGSIQIGNHTKLTPKESSVDENYDHFGQREAIKDAFELSKKIGEVAGKTLGKIGWNGIKNSAKFTKY